MQYKPKLMTHNPNVSHDQPVREFITLLLIGITLLFLAFILLSYFLESALLSISPEDEQQLFQYWQTPHHSDAAEALQQSVVLQQKINALKQCADIHTPITIHAYPSANINAYAFPGGRIVVFDEWLKQMSSENGLMFVLAHELAHFKQRDHLRGLGRGMILLGISVVLSGANSNLSSMLASMFSYSQAQYSQQQEQQADAKALNTLQCYYGHVGGATEFFEFLKGRDEGSFISHYFSSHPELQARIDMLKLQAKQQGYVFQETQ